ncbi:iron-containing redox enzyme family protein [Tolypothrix campylonemoides VB511288]|nr:iron-containing redox enzyme family protein [Tolypothrix campylonemoides VB511288]
MKEVLALIEKRKQEFAQLPLFQFLQNKSIDPRKRLAWAPCVTPIAMSFEDLLKYDFRKEPTDDPIQELINKHTEEEDNHWMWFLEDLEKLGFDYLMKFSDSMRFYWGEETYKTRQVCHQIALHTFRSEPIVVLAAMEAIEATANVAFALTAQVAQELQQITKQKYRFFGQYHVGVESAHTVLTNDAKQFLESIQLTQEQRAKAFEVVEKVFEVFTEATNEMRTYAEKHSLVQTLRTS